MKHALQRCTPWIYDKAFCFSIASKRWDGCVFVPVGKLSDFRRRRSYRWLGSVRVRSWNNRKAIGWPLRCITASHPLAWSKCFLFLVDPFQGDPVNAAMREISRGEASNSSVNSLDYHRDYDKRAWSLRNSADICFGVHRRQWLVWMTRSFVNSYKKYICKTLSELICTSPNR